MSAALKMTQGISKEGCEIDAALDLRVFLERAKAAGELQEIPGAHWNLEIGALAEISAESDPCPALLFDKIPDYPCSGKCPERHACSGEKGQWGSHKLVYRD